MEERGELLWIGRKLAERCTVQEGPISERLAELLKRIADKEPPDPPRPKA